MPEIKREVQAYEIKYACDDCLGKYGCMLVRNNLVSLTYPPLYCYECPLCKKEYKFTEDYPKVVFE